MEKSVVNKVNSFDCSSYTPEELERASVSDSLKFNSLGELMAYELSIARSALQDAYRDQCELYLQMSRSAPVPNATASEIQTRIHIMDDMRQRLENSRKALFR